jgi:anti-sigma regulatory factor (Ser/Thr protein kinase)
MSSRGSEAKDRLVIGNTVAEMAKVVEFVEKFGAAHGIPQAAINDLNVCLDELLNNTISYGYDDQEPHSIAVDLTLAADLLITDIKDDGKPFDPRQGTPKPSSGTIQSRAIGGLGLHFVKTLMNEVGYTRTGGNNVVRLVKKLRREAGHGNG